MANARPATHPTAGKSVLQRYLTALEAGDQDAVRAVFADDATWTIAAGDLPIGGTWRGRDAIVDEFLPTAMSYYEPGSANFEVSGMIEEGERVVLQWTSRARTRAGCRPRGRSGVRR